MTRKIQFGRLLGRISAICALATALVLAGVPARAQAAGSAKSAAAPTTQATAAPPALPAMPVEQGPELDRVVAIVNGELILDSDVEQEKRFSALLPYGEAGGAYSRDRAIERLVNRDLILQQARLQPGDEVTDAAVAKDLESLRKSVPACRQTDCESKPGWDSFLKTQGFTESSLNKLWRERMQVLAFIELRFRMGIKISQAQIQAYYDTDLKSQFAAQHATAPPLDTISTRIQEVLLQQQVSSLLSDWLRSLRAQGSVVVLHPGEEAP